jgi:hypothetical protein
MHARLMKAALRETNYRGIEDLRASILGRLYLGLGHRENKVNERSFIVKSSSLRMVGMALRAVRRIQKSDTPEVYLYPDY